MLRIRKDDQIVVISGKEKGKSGKVIRVMPERQGVLVENVNVVKKAVRKSDKYPQGGYVEMERPVHISNVMLTDKKIHKPVRFGVKNLQDGSKIRINRKSQEAL